jgi:hypothetical protein
MPLMFIGSLEHSVRVFIMGEIGKDHIANYINCGLTLLITENDYICYIKKAFITTSKILA